MQPARTGMFGLVVAFSWFSLYAYLPILPSYARDLGASYEMIGLIVGSYGFTQMVLRLPLGIISDKWCKRKLFVIAGMAFCLVSASGMFIFDTVFSLLVFRTLSGFAATTWVIQTVLYTSYFPQSLSPKAMGRISAYSTAGQLVATLLGGFIAYHWGDSYTFLLAAAGGTVAFILSFWITEHRPQVREPITLQDIAGIGREQTVVSASILAMLIQVVTYGTAYGFIPIAGKNLGANSFEIGLLPTLFMIPGMFASAYSGTFFVSYLGKKTAVILGFSLMAVPVMAIPLIHDLYWLYISQMVAGFGRGIAFPLLMQHSISTIQPHQRATAMGYFQSIYGLGMVIGPIIVGVLGDCLSINWGFAAVGFVGLIGMTAAAWWLAPDKEAALA